MGLRMEEGMGKGMVSLIITLQLAGSPPSSLRGETGNSGDSGIHRPVTSREVEQLKQEILDDTRSSVEGIFEYRNETGDLNNRLDFLRYGARLNYKWTPGAMLYLRGSRTSYMTIGDVLNEHGTNLTAGLRTSLSEAASAQLEVGGTRFSTDGATVNALGSLRFNSETLSVTVTGSRTNVEESLLSAAGIRAATGPFAGRVVGQVLDNRAAVGLRYRLFPRFELFGNGAVGTRTGKNIESNFFQQAGGGAGYTIFSSPDDAAVTQLQASYVLEYFGFDKNLLGYGGVSLLDRRGRLIPPGNLGSDGLSPIAGAGRAGVGGYFSPARFLSNVGRLELQGRPDRHFEYRLAGFVGAQRFTGSALRQASGVSGTVSARLTDRVSIPITYLRDNFGPFTQQSLFFSLVVRL